MGQNIFPEDSDKLSIWLESLNENYLYKALLKANTTEDLKFNTVIYQLGTAEKTWCSFVFKFAYY